MGVASLTEICTQTFENVTRLCVLFFACKEPITSVNATIPAEFLNYLHSMLVKYQNLNHAQYLYDVTQFMLERPLYPCIHPAGAAIAQSV
jgi:hypothetical protein